MKRRSLTLRWRWALWCAGLVTATGVIAVVVLLAVTSRMLRERNAEANGLDPERPQSQQIPPGGGPRPFGGPPPGQGVGPSDQLQRGGEVANRTIRDARTIGIAMVGGFAVLSLGVGWFVAGRMVRPLHEITKVADEVAGGRFGQRIELDGPRDELKAMADTFDTMLDRLDTAFGAQREFVADASHELRTPLTVMRAEIDVALDDPEADAEALRDAMAATSVALARTTRLVESLLALSRSEVLVHVEDHDLRGSVERAVAVHPTGRSPLLIDLAPAPVRGDTVLLDRVVDNLVENAVRYTPDGGTIDITTGSLGTDSFVRVANDGPVFDQSEVTALFERFHRHDGRRNTHGGAGLGLAIVESSVRTHGGTVTATPRPAGGIEIEVRLPAIPA